MVVKKYKAQCGCSIHQFGDEEPVVSYCGPGHMKWIDEDLFPDWVWSDDNDGKLHDDLEYQDG